jgi:hypothetical protein
MRSEQAMRKRSLTAAAVLALLVAGPPALAQPRPGTAELPVSRVLLFSSGVGYFQREGQVEGSTRLDLQFRSQTINDLLKSLVVQDQGGGQVSTVHYDNRDPIDKTLKTFAIDLTTNPSIGQLLNQVRGERVEVHYTDDPLRGGQATPCTGLIVGVEKQRRQVGKDQVVEIEQLNLLTAEGLKGVPLGQVQRVRLLKLELEQEFRKALEILATAHDQQKKTVSLNCVGQGRRTVRCGYVTESPLWKTSYRLSVDKDQVHLQGWAIVENTTDEDWNGVRLSLVSGRPLSFLMDLYEPLYVPRPVVEPELFASLRPPTYGGALESRDKATPPPEKKPAAAAPEPASIGRPAEEAKRLKADAGDVLRRLAEGEALGKDRLMDLHEGVASAALTTELGEYFHYQIEHPVSLPRQKSALIPIVDKAVEGTKVSIYNEGVHAKFPLRGLRFKNTTALHLTQGPVTVFEDKSYAGDARLTHLQPGESRLVSYAIDLSTEVEPAAKKLDDTLLSVKVAKGILYASFKQRASKTYTITNRSQEPRRVVIEHPYRPDFQLVEPAKPAERTREFYRFEVTAGPDQTVQQEVIEEQTRVQQVVLTGSDDDTLRYFLRASASNEQVKQALEQALKLKGDLAQTRREMQTEEQALKVIDQEQGRLRANMERVPQTAELFKRYLQKLEEQETEIEKRREKIAKLNELAERQRQAFEDYVLALTLD